MDNLIRTAIQEKRLIRFRYDDKLRIAEPHDYGIQNGRLRLLAYQVHGASTGKLPGWRWIEVPRISDLEILAETFEGSRGNESNKHHVWDEVFARVS
ncbi:MAG: hypothetical protein DMG60_22830 [Acidobacteria bacterium]|nr:MAG: hypothetical protein DMG60_22830 [Acidobacteriota bacterium]